MYMYTIARKTVKKVCHYFLSTTDRPTFWISNVLLSINNPFHNEINGFNEGHWNNSIPQMSLKLLLKISRAHTFSAEDCFGGYTNIIVIIHIYLWQQFRINLSNRRTTSVFSQITEKNIYRLCDNIYRLLWWGCDKYNKIIVVGNDVRWMEIVWLRVYKTGKTSFPTNTPNIWYIVI